MSFSDADLARLLLGLAVLLVAAHGVGGVFARFGQPAAIGEIAARLIRDATTVQAWEVATGSGAVALAIALRFRTAIALERLRLAASDLSSEALELAAENLAAHGVSGAVTLACGDLLEPAA